MKRVAGLSTLLAAALMTHGVQAETEISGFVTAGATYGDSEVSSYDGTFQNKTNSAALNRLGIQISADVNPKVSVTGQLLARGNDPAGRYNVNADWAFVTYKAADAASVRVGKLKLTSYLISDYYEVGYAYPWVRPPQEVYSTNPITAIDGVDALVRFNFGNNSLLLQPYAGSGRDIYAVQPQETMMPDYTSAVGYILTQTERPDGSPWTPEQAQIIASQMPLQGDINYIQFTTENMGGINIALTNPYFTVRAGHFSTRVYQDDFGLTGDKGTYTSAGVTADWRNIVFYSEYFERDVEGLANFAFPNQKGYYATVGYRFGPTLVHYTRASLADNDNPIAATANPLKYPQPGTPLAQRSHTAGVRYELGSAAALKFDVQRATPGKGTRGLFVSDPDALTQKDRSESVNLYSLALDIIF